MSASARGAYADRERDGTHTGAVASRRRNPHPLNCFTYEPLCPRGNASTVVTERARSRRRVRHGEAIPMSAAETNLPECNRCQTKRVPVVPPW